MSKIAIFPGSFDPFTKGHEDVVLRGLKIFDELIIGIGLNSKKQRYFEKELISEKIAEAFSSHSQVQVKIFKGLTAEFAKENNANFILRGLRNTTDFEFENTISQINRDLWEGLETVFLITSPEYASISSTVIREIHKFDRNVDKYLPYKL
jgi:pantetheine-phosphate adenylyltransferase